LKRKLSILLQWTVLLLVVGTVYVRVTGMRETPVARVVERAQWDGFMALSYAGAGRWADTRSPSAATVEEHLRALAAAGYETIETRDVMAFLEGRRALPRKALYLMLENDLKSTTVRVHSVLEDLDLRAALYLNLTAVGSWNPFTLDPGDVGRVNSRDRWDVQSRGLEQMAAVPVDAAGNRGYFLLSRRWDPDLPGLESWEDYAERLRFEFEQSQAQLADLSNGTPLATVLFPSNFVDPDSRSIVSVSVLEAARAQFQLAFARAGDAFNSRETDAFNLTRMEVPPDWDAARLLAELERQQPRSSWTAGADAAADAAADPWRDRSGEHALTDSGVVVVADGEGEGFVRLHGSPVWKDFELRTSVRRDAGAMAVVYLRHHDADNHVRVAVDDQAVRLQEMITGDLYTLAQVELPSLTEEVDLRVLVRGDRLAITVDAVPLTDWPSPINPSMGSGSIGVGVLGRAAVRAEFPSLAVHRLAPLWMETGAANPGRQVTVRLYAPPGGEDDAYLDELIANRSKGIRSSLRVGIQTPPAAVLGQAPRSAVHVNRPALRQLIAAVVLPVDGSGADLLLRRTRQWRGLGFEVAWRGDASTLEGLLATGEATRPDWIMSTTPGAGADPALARVFPPDRTLAADAGLAGVWMQTAADVRP